jgi:hypothetical protein
MENTQIKLQIAANGLLMMSESDYPFAYFVTDAKAIDEKLALHLADKPEGTTIEEITLDHLLRNMTDASIGSVTEEEAVKFRGLADALKAELAGLKVYRVGDVQVDVFIIGTTADGAIAGMRTKLIET